MDLVQVHLRNWRSYRNATFAFDKPKGKKRVVLVGAMNGTGKTSLLIGLYLGLFGREGMGFVEGVRTGSTEAEHAKNYRALIRDILHRPALGDDHPLARVALTFDHNGDSIEINRTWYYTKGGNPRPLDADGEQVRLLLNGKPQRLQDWREANDRIGRLLFPAHISPCFFFDGEQAQKRVEASGSYAMAEAVRVLFGTRLAEELDDSLQNYVKAERTALRREVGSVDLSVLELKRDERDLTQKQAREAAARLEEVLRELDQAQARRDEALADLTRLTGDQHADIKQLAEELAEVRSDAHRKQEEVQDQLAGLALPLALRRHAVHVIRRIESERIRDEWLSLRETARPKVEEIVKNALRPSKKIRPPLSPKQLEALDGQLRKSMETLWHPPPQGCADKLLYGFLSPHERTNVAARLEQLRHGNHDSLGQLANDWSYAKSRQRKLQEQYDQLSDLGPRLERVRDSLSTADKQLSELLQERARLETKTEALRAEVRSMNGAIGQLEHAEDQLSPVQARVDVASRVRGVIDELRSTLVGVCHERLEDRCTLHFRAMVSAEFRNHSVHFDMDRLAPVLRPSDSRKPDVRVGSLSGAQRRAFGLALSLSLFDISTLPAPLIIDTPVGNADSEYRKRMLSYLAKTAPGQVIFLSHDEEIHGPYQQVLEPYLLDQWRVDFEELEDGAGIATPIRGAYFEPAEAGLQ